jgi:hypothetical protein
MEMTADDSKMPTYPLCPDFVGERRMSTCCMEVGRVQVIDFTG